MCACAPARDGDETHDQRPEIPLGHAFGKALFSCQKGVFKAPEDSGICRVAVRRQARDDECGVWLRPQTMEAAAQTVANTLPTFVAQNPKDVTGGSL